MPDRLQEEALLGFAGHDGGAFAPSLQQSVLEVQDQFRLRLAMVLYIRGEGAWSGRRDQGGGWLYVGCEFFAVLGEGPKVAFDLEPVPKVLGLAEEDAEADGHGGSDGAPA